MTTQSSNDRVRYTTPENAEGATKRLVAGAGTPREREFVFYDRLEIGRDDEDREASPGLLLVAEPTISFQHCTVTQTPDGRCFVRDVSRNGTRLDGRRLVPNVETDLRLGQTLTIGSQHFVLAGDPATDAPAGAAVAGFTVGAPGSTIATVLVGDIRDYTVLVRRVPSAALQHSVNRVFEILSAAVEEHGGTVKEYQGDAVFAFWEGDLTGTQAVSACRAARSIG